MKHLKLQLIIAIFGLIITQQAVALNSSCQLFQTKPAHVVTWSWLDATIYDHVFVVTEAVWTGGSDALDTFHNVWQPQPVVHWIPNPTPNTGYGFIGGSHMFALYSYPVGVIGKSDECVNTLFYSVVKK